MKKLISILLVLAFILTCTAAGADFASATKTQPTANRNIKINKAGDNPWPTDGTSPTTGRDLAQVYKEYIEKDPDRFSGMAESGEYNPIMVQHCGYNGGVGVGAPWYGTAADVYYEMVKAKRGYTRMSMIFNDVYPPYAGASRSIRVGHLFIRQEWNAPFLFAGMQEQTFNSKYNTDVNYMRRKLNVPSSFGTNEAKDNYKVMFDALNGGKKWLAYKYRYKNYGQTYNVVWNLSGIADDLLGGRDYAGTDNAFGRPFNHTFRFGDMKVEGDSAETIYVIFESTTAKTDDSEGTTYFNSMYSYDADENVYYRYMISDMKNPDNNPVLFREQVIANESSTLVGGTPTKNGYFLDGTATPGEAITFANVIVQYAHIEFPDGGEAPYPLMTGTGNADFFIGGKHYTGVWDRTDENGKDSYNSRTVFYGEDGEEISLQPGRTMIIIMDWDSTFGNGAHREVRYE